MVIWNMWRAEGLLLNRDLEAPLYIQHPLAQILTSSFLNSGVLNLASTACGCCC